MPEKFQTLPRDNVPMSQGDPTYQTPEKLQTLPRDNVPTTSAYAEPLTDQVNNSTYCINDTSYSTIHCIL